MENDRFWWKDPVKKKKHSDLTKAGMERARQAGRLIGVLRAEDREGFAEKFAMVLPLLEQKTIARKQAAKELGISGPTLTRVLDDHIGATHRTPIADGERVALVV